MSAAIPQHIAFILDGNRRWAKARGLPTLQGHRAGYDRAMELGEWCLEAGIKYLTVYAFSTENWNRSKREVAYLMRLLKLGMTREIKKLHKKGIRVRVIGKIHELSKDLQKAIHDAEELTQHNTAGTMNFAINYGGRWDITEAVRKAAKAGEDLGKLTPEILSRYVYTAGQPDPDLIVRTSGEQRLSGFLAWQSVYSELLFVKKPFPAFTKKDFQAVLAAFVDRNRRYGK